jgi:hypothetical protein
VDLKVYYQKIRDNEAGITEPFPIVVSQETGDGGKAGIFTEVPRAVAAKLMADGTARTAGKDEAAAFRADLVKAKKAADELAAAAKMQVRFISADELTRLENQKGKG